MSEPTTAAAAITSGDEAALHAALAADPSAADGADAAGVPLLLLALYHRRPDLAAVVRAAKRVPLTAAEATAVGDVDRLRAALAEDPSSAGARTADGFTALHYAAFFAQPVAVPVLLDVGAPVDAVSDNPMRVQPLHSALAAGQLAIAKTLLDAGAPPSTAQAEGYTPLHGAAHHGAAELVELLLAAGADIAARTDAGATPAQMARDAGHAALADRLNLE